MIRKKIGKAKTGRKSPFKPKTSTSMTRIPVSEITTEVFMRSDYLIVYPQEGKPLEVKEVTQFNDDKYEIVAEGKHVTIPAETELHIYH